MTKYNPPDPIALDRGFHALAELAAPYGMALPSFLQHVRVLESAGLVATRKEGRVRRCRLETARLAELDAWITRYQTAWAARLDRRDDFLDATDTKGTAT